MPRATAELKASGIEAAALKAGDRAPAFTVAAIAVSRESRIMAEYDLRSIAFPTLDEAQIAEIGRFADGPARHYRDGETVIATGERDYQFLLVMAGEIEIIDRSGDQPNTVV